MDYYTQALYIEYFCDILFKLDQEMARYMKQFKSSGNDKYLDLYWLCADERRNILNTLGNI